MEFGLFLANQFEMDRSLDGIADELIAQTKLARDTGFSSLYIGEHHATDDRQYLLNEPLLAYLAGHIGEMTIETGMCLLPYHNPVRIAEYGATMDVLTGGQFRLGVAQGYRPKEYEVFGVDKADGLARFVEGIQLIKRLWTEDGVTYDGKVYSFDDVTINPKPIQDPRPEIIAGASNESSVRRAAKLTDGWLGAHVPFDQATDQAAAFRDERNKQDADEGFVGIAREVFVADTTEEAESAVRDHLTAKYESYSAWGQDDVIEGDDFGSPWEKLKHGRFIVGTPAEVVAELERYQETMDPDQIMIRTQFPGMGFGEANRSIELLGEEVLPEVQ
ncbi:LLM class flavin-dependent oxidoreductase [Halomarina halobia]|uniref:LLM class flavin-dependent oxidoreductase n=1 Tax=Halomarina halobia TaxID=3033386 RepID=A0ABD6AES6_9EURY|nr:LLM class flavin-dependent oxidoreductase [Halomarina sp. PSR21]